MYDLIGDIHGHADELEQLLSALGYQKQYGVYRHPKRRVIYLGDFIDRGPKIRQVLELVRPMIEEKHALAVIGNHELNALAFHIELPKGSGNYLRRRSNKNIRQHYHTLAQLTDSQLLSALEWFRTLPLWLELPGSLRVVHACWDPHAIAAIERGLQHHGGVTNEFLYSACLEGNDLFAPIEAVLKGKEAELPEGEFFLDKDGHKRTAVRARWYLPPDGQTYRTYAFQSAEINCDLRLDQAAVASARPYSANDIPVFVGHYWLSADSPQILSDNVACVDYSVAKGGFLCAYRWNGERKLSNENFVWINDGRVQGA